MPNARLLSIPASEPCCQHITIWHEQPVPVVFTRACHYIVSANIVVLNTQTTDPRYVALAVSTAPAKTLVDDHGFVDFRPSDCGIWKSALISGFSRNGESIPIIDPTKLLSDECNFMAEANNACIKPGKFFALQRQKTG
ncbi:hypothetical protein BTA51_16960 [Hahella sp. CCB-MM4]|nr:hypothetical protein BTA51_16960 [Hahella sp. CCB-MM4]